MPAFAAPGNPAKHVISSPPIIEVIPWEDRMRVETVLSMRTLVCHFKHVMHRVGEYL